MHTGGFRLFKQPVEWRCGIFRTKNRHGIFINHVKRCVFFWINTWLYIQTKDKSFRKKCFKFKNVDKKRRILLVFKLFVGVIKNEYLSTFEYFIGWSCYTQEKKNNQNRNDYVYEKKWYGVVSLNFWNHKTNIYFPINKWCDHIRINIIFDSW